MPPYTDNEACQETHKRKDEDEPEKRTKFLKENPSWENFRDNCFKSAEQKVACSWLEGWCIECGRKTGWTLEQKRGMTK